MSADSEKAVVSAVPMYDVELKSVGEVNSLGNFDFSTGGSDAPNKGAGEFYGRLLDFAVAIRLKAADNDKGMKGFYVPEEVEEWTFRIDTKIMEDKNETSLQALLWDYKENKRSETGQNGRDLTNGSSGQGLYFAGSPAPHQFFGPVQQLYCQRRRNVDIYTKRRRKHRCDGKGSKPLR